MWGVAFSINWTEDLVLGFKLCSLAIYLHFCAWLLLWVSICLVSLMESGHSFTSFLCFHFVSWCLKTLLFMRKRITRWGTGIGSIRLLLELISGLARFSPGWCQFRQTWLWVTSKTGWSSPPVSNFFDPESLALRERECSFWFSACWECELLALCSEGVGTQDMRCTSTTFLPTVTTSRGVV